MGQHRQLPGELRQVHPRYRTPYIAIMIFAAIATVTLLPGKTDFLATFYSFGAMLSFTIAHVSVIQLRRRKSQEERPWKPPLNFHAFGAELPLTAVLGGLGTFAAWIVVMALYPRTLIVGLGWMVFGVAIYVIYRRSQKLPQYEISYGTPSTSLRRTPASARRDRGSRIPGTTRRSIRRGVGCWWRLRGESGLRTDIASA